MLAVNPEYRNLGIGRRLKLFQRDEALARGIRRMEWTFDPLEIKNSFLNVARLGAIVRRYAPNFYGVSSSRLHGQVPTDRLYAEWWLDSDWVCSALGGKPVAVPAVEDEIAVPHQIAQWRHSPADLKRVLDIQTGNREHFEQAFARQLAVIGFRIDSGGNGIFQLGRWQEPEFSLPEH
jgi:predicted GNAT superfamily acetyltransferase